MTPLEHLKALVAGAAFRFGYTIEKIYDYGEYRLDVFQILIEQLDPSDPDFFVLQVGANDGETLDPIRRSVLRYHWKGILLEPLPDAFAKLSANYRDQPQLVLENAALARRDGTAEIWTLSNSSGLQATFDRTRLTAHLPGHTKVVPITVRTVSVSTLLRTHQVDRIDLLQIDTEGFDFEVLKMLFHESSLRPRLIRYEHVHLSHADRAACVDLLAHEGYRMFPDFIDTIALRPKHS